jgi:uncharacterized protein (TIGR02145 family)
MSVAESGGSGTFRDGRDGKTYRTVVIGGKTWMAENMNYEMGKSWCYDNDNSNCNKYGRLYMWNAAKTACPSGWHLPTVQEWDNLSQAAGGVRKSVKVDGLGDLFYWDGAGRALKSTSGWNDYDGASGNGANVYGFSALPGGSRNAGDDFLNAGYYGYWWAATENGSGLAYGRVMSYNIDDLHENYNRKDYALSVRCVRD